MNGKCYRKCFEFLLLLFRYVHYPNTLSAVGLGGILSDSFLQAILSFPARDGLLYDFSLV